MGTLWKKYERAAGRQHTAAGRAEIAIRMMLEARDTDDIDCRAYDDCWECGDGDQVAACFMVVALANDEHAGNRLRVAMRRWSHYMPPKFLAAIREAYPAEYAQGELL